MADNIESQDLQVLNANPHPGPEQMHTVVSAFHELGQQGVGVSPDVQNHIREELSTYLKGLTPDERTQFGQAYQAGAERQPYRGFMLPAGGSGGTPIWHSDLPGATVNMDGGKLKYIQFDRVGAMEESRPSADSYRVEAPKN